MLYQLLIGVFLVVKVISISLSVPNQNFLQLRNLKDVPTKYDVVKGLFVQTDDETDALKFDINEDNFGLKKDKSWDDVLDKLKDLNDNDDGEVYKLFFLARHGEGYHNIAGDGYPEKNWTCYWSIQDGNSTMEWYDALLTDNGHDQINTLSDSWKSQLYTNNAPLPQSYYVSPMRRCLQTYNYTWSSILNDTKVPLIKEFARETYGIDSQSRRHNKTYIEDFVPSYKFEDGFTQQDELWEADKNESSEHRDYRATVLFNDIFSSDSSDVISITSHSGTVSSMLKVLNHRKFSLKTGQMIPVLVKASDFGTYTPPDLSDKDWATLPKECDSFSEF